MIKRLFIRNHFRMSDLTIIFTSLLIRIGTIVCFGAITSEMSRFWTAITSSTTTATTAFNEKFFKRFSREFKHYHGHRGNHHRCYRHHRRHRNCLHAVRCNRDWYDLGKEEQWLMGREKERFSHQVYCNYSKHFDCYPMYSRELDDPLDCNDNW